MQECSGSSVPANALCLSDAVDGDACSVELPIDTEYWCALAANSYSIHERHLLSNTSDNSRDGQHVVFCQLHTQMLLPAHAVIVDLERRVLAVTIRGTTSISDLIADLAGCIVDISTGDQVPPLASDGAMPSSDASSANVHSVKAETSTSHAPRTMWAPVGVHGGILACADSFMTAEYSAAAMSDVVRRTHALLANGTMSCGLRLPCPSILPALVTADTGPPPASSSESSPQRFDVQEESHAALAISAALGLSGLAATLWYVIHTITESAEAAIAQVDTTVDAANESHEMLAILRGIRSWPIVLAGHSLGAGVSALLLPKLKAALAPLYSIHNAVDSSDERCESVERHQPCIGAAPSLPRLPVVHGLQVDSSALHLPHSAALARLHALDVTATSPAPVFAALVACPAVAGPELSCVLEMSPMQLERLCQIDCVGFATPAVRLDDADVDASAILAAYCNARPVLPRLIVKRMPAVTPMVNSAVSAPSSKKSPAPEVYATSAI